MHGFRFSADIQGHVLTFGAALVANLEQRLGAPLAVLSKPVSYPLGRDRAHLRSLIETLQQEYQGNAPSRAAMLEALVTALMVWISRRQQLGQARARAMNATASCWGSICAWSKRTTASTCR